VQLNRKALAFGQLPATKGDLYAPPSGSKGLVHNIVLHNANTTAETVVLNYHDGTSEYEIFNQSLSAGETVIWDFKGAGDIVEDGGKYTGNTDTASKVTYKVDGTEESPSGSSLSVVGANLWAPPDQPHAEDDEFESSSLTGWVAYNASDTVAATLSEGAVDSYDTTFTSGNVVRVNANSVERRSWWQVQVPSSSKLFYIAKPYTLPTNLLMWSRMRFSTGTTLSANDTVISLNFFTESGGNPGIPNQINLSLNSTGSGLIQAVASYRTTSWFGFESTTDVDVQGQALEYAAIHKLGSTYKMWVGTASGNWIYLATYTPGFTPDMAGFSFRNVTNSDPAPHVVGTDFLRFLETDNFLL